MPAPSVFISYSHKDEVWKDRLVTHLGVLQNQGLLQTWTDRDIGAGDEWFEEIRNAMNAARVAVLLISASSLTSKFILHTEIPHLLERRAREGMAVFPVLCTACLWQEIPWLARLQARPRDDKALASFRGNRLESELAKIAKEILEISRNGSTAIAGYSPTTTSTVSSLPVLHQLPAPPADFTGRAEVLSTLKSALTRGGTGAIFGLQGMGGVGKTTLALKLAEELESLYPDAQLYLDLKGVDPHPLSATQAMAHVVRSFHPEARLPENEAEMAGLYRSVLHGKRALLLMDNAGEDRRQVEPLIPPAGSLLLVTSRFRFTLPGLIVRDLDELPDADACNLLLRIAPRIGTAAEEIARLCGRLPLALRLAGSALAERSNLSPADYARRLKEGKERFGPVEASLDLSYELLSKDQQRLWRLLAVFPGTFDEPATAAVWDLETDSATNALGELVQGSLVEWEDKDGRYRLHDLARSFADRRLEGMEKEVARKRHAEHYLGVLWAADGLYKKGGESILQGLRLFDTEWGNLQEGQAWAARHFSEDDEVARICSGYPDAGSFLLELRQHPRDRIYWEELALAAARQRKDRRAEGVHLGNLGLAYWSLGEPRRAIEFYEQRLPIAREIGDRHGEGQVLGSLGLAYWSLGDPRRAIEFYEQQLAIAREIGDRRGEGSVLNNLGIAYAELGDPRRAIEFYEQKLVIVREIRDRRLEASALGNLGIAYKNLGEPHRAIEFYEQQLTIAREIGDRLGEANASWNFGLALEKEGDLSRVADLMQVRVDYQREIGHPDAEKHAAHVAALRARIAEQNS
jgi:tetratricopeptide (TPR) repeat protein